MMKSTSGIFEDPLYSILMTLKRLIHQLTSFVDSRADLRPCNDGILHGTYNLPIVSRILKVVRPTLVSLRLDTIRVGRLLASPMFVLASISLIYFVSERNRLSLE